MLIRVLRDYGDIFAWEPKDMPGVDLEVTVNLFVCGFTLQTQQIDEDDILEREGRSHSGGGRKVVGGRFHPGVDVLNLASQCGFGAQAYWDMADVHRLHQHQQGMSEGLLPSCQH
ncbi:hypothetical protein LIER_07482 [Lithospermum erythrorhizon]|uniref:Uncharacterized protein n=1 Tax=Lithospermum erythrorhizon TaxID=34254 RepID=A0AAV3P9K2_LITER